MFIRGKAKRVPGWQASKRMLEIVAAMLGFN
jgi:hypothetical protein